jgi:phosphoribosylformylglycinamidine cyclo-ligase
MDYKSAGVDIDKADTLIDDVRRFAKDTYTKGVMSGVGGFGALFELGKYKDPVIVSSTDGVGTKILLAEKLGKYRGLGFDLVAMCVDDIVCSGAKPLFFLDYIAIGKLREEFYRLTIESIAKACKFSGSALIGGETAELPGMYADEEFDLAGFSVGVVEKSKILDPKTIRKGDAVIGLASSGFHSNGYSLVRKVLNDKGLDLAKDYGFGVLGDVLITPTEIFSPVLVEALAKFGSRKIKGIAHITGGGIEGNLCRVLPENLDALVKKGTWKVRPEFEFIASQGGISEDEAFKVFNMGLGMMLVVDAGSRDKVLEYFNGSSYRAWEVGSIVEGKGEVRFA